MKRLNMFLLFALMMILSSVPVYADDFYYNGGVHYNPYNGYTVMSLPPPPPMTEVPFYVRDDYDDYVEDYYKCILGYEYKGFTCRYWRKYAERHGLYQRTAPQQSQQNGVIQNGGMQNNVNQNMQSNVDQSMQNNVNSNMQGNNQAVSNGAVNPNNSNQIQPYTPTH